MRDKEIHNVDESPLLLYIMIHQRFLLSIVEVLQISNYIMLM